MAYSQEDKERIVNSVCEMMVSGESLTQSCIKNDISKVTLFRWFEKDEALCNQYARARDLLIQTHAQEILDLADDKDADPQRSRLQVDARKWVLSKLMPKTFGDKLSLAGDKDNPVQVVSKIERVIVDSSN